jgi:hypothetical protein
MGADSWTVFLFRCYIAKLLHATHDVGLVVHHQLLSRSTCTLYSCCCTCADIGQAAHNTCCVGAQQHRCCMLYVPLPHLMGMHLVIGMRARRL